MKIRQTNYQEAAMSYYWTPEHRARQSAAIRQWRPWEHSTGPKSEEGRVSRNAYKGGTRAILRKLGRLLREQGEALKRIMCSRGGAMMTCGTSRAWIPGMPRFASKHTGVGPGGPPHAHLGLASLRGLDPRETEVV
jgi:hypothetical protein